MLSFQSFTANIQAAFQLASRADGGDRLGAAVQERISRGDQAVAKAMAVLEERAMRSPSPSPSPSPGKGPGATPAPQPGQAAAATPVVQLSSAAQTAAAGQSASVNVPGDIEQYTPNDFTRLKSVSTMRSVENNMQFSLTTKDGDTVTLDLSSFDYEAKTRLKAETADGSQVRGRASDSESTRALAISITGDLDADERKAVDELVSDVVKVARKFFQGNDSGALKKALQLDFDSSELTGFALNLSQTETRVRETVKYQQAPAATEPMANLARRDADVADLFSNLADSARSLIEQAAEIFDPRSAATFGRNVLPVVIKPSE